MSTNRPAPTRRGFFNRLIDGVHGAALGSLLAPNARGGSGGAEVYDLSPKKPHHEPKAKAVIHLFQNGGPSQVDLFDPKPTLRKFAGQLPGRDIVNQIESPDQIGVMMPSPFPFKRYGKSGIELSELLPHTGSVCDKIAFIRSMYGEHFNHEPALYLMHSGRTLPGRPSLGAWVTYGLGSENQNLPAYAVLDDPKGLPINGIQNWQAGWLPPLFQGTRFRSTGLPLLNLKPPEQLPATLVEAQRELRRNMDGPHRAARPGYGDLDARIAGFEMAARMQVAATDALDLSRESESTKEMYGMNNEVTESYGRRCLMARRLIERGVRFVQVFIESQIWDNHHNLVTGLRACCAKTDRPSAALVRDLDARGLLDSTLVIWGGEFGRMPCAQVQQGGDGAGRDHGPAGFTLWMAGGGVKGGTAYGATDEIGYRAAEQRVSVHDFHATMLHQLGLSFRALSFQRHSLPERLTDQYPARVIHDILA
ncbi:MAG: DUF1501 domain-containing protein [Acidobacteria bacterium]|nr:DUF1501 domain-containing protein [Acidobacteriota bacterium]